MMNLMTMTSSFDIWWVSILIHILNLAILVVGLWLLLHNPVKKFIKKRQEQIALSIEETNRAQREAEDKRQEYEGLVSQAKQEVAKASETAKAHVDIQKKQILDTAHKEANEILSVAKVEAMKEKKRAEIALKEDIADISVDIASKLIGRELTDNDNKKIIDECLKNWGEHE